MYRLGTCISFPDKLPNKMDVIRTGLFTRVSNTLTLLTYRPYTIHIPNGFPISQCYTENKHLFMNTMETRDKQKIQIY